MLNGIVVGTLATVSQVLTPFGGLGEPVEHVYKIEAKECQKGFLKVSSGEKISKVHFLSLNLKKCRMENPKFDTAADFAKNLSLDLEKKHKKIPEISNQDLNYIIPDDALDESFLEKLPVHASYVSTHMLSVKNFPVKVQIKITKEPSINDMLVIKLDWLPQNASQQSLPNPIKVWLKQGQTSKSEFKWSKLETSEFGNSLEIDISSEIKSPKLIL